MWVCLFVGTVTQTKHSTYSSVAVAVVQTQRLLSQLASVFCHAMSFPGVASLVAVGSVAAPVAEPKLRRADCESLLKEAMG